MLKLFHFLILTYIISEQAVYTTTSRGRIQLMYCGQSYYFERTSKEKTYWVCSQNRNQNCRARLYTINHIITPVNMQHKHNKSNPKPERRSDDKGPVSKVDMQHSLNGVVKVNRPKDKPGKSVNLMNEHIGSDNKGPA